ncbi:AraC family transcriptional regulator ligand-binding domain-containing protein [Pseudomonas sp. CAU 1711]|uniref:AraC family transcriptional regulator n=1 Tax=Pseudomonas sp. CAU 1711 TaxID=3140356 RepID=UPI0032614F73
MIPPLDLPLTHSSTLRLLLYEALAALGFEPGEIYRSAFRDIPLGPPSSEAREPHDLAPPFWQALPRLTGDPDIGLHLGELMQPRPLDVVSYLQLASRDLREALEVFVRYQHIVSGGFAAALQVEGERARLVIDLNYLGHGSLRQQMECLAVLFGKHLAQLCGQPVPLLGLSLRHAAPRRLQEHRRLFGLTPRFEAEHDALEFSVAWLSRPSRNAAPGIFAVLRRHADEQLAELAGNSLINRVRYWQASRLGQGVCDLGGCAEALGLPRAVLQRALLVHGTGFRPLLEELRRQRSQTLLHQGCSIRDVARACGFAELSPFYRAFRRWWGCTPQQWLRLQCRM